MASNYLDLPAYGNFTWKAPVDSAVYLPVLNNTPGDVRITLDTETLYLWNDVAWIAIATPGAAIAITGLIGDVTATGPGAVVSSLVATSNSTLATLTALTSVGTAGTLAINGGLRYSVRTVSSASYMVDSISNDALILTDSTSNAISITLPPPTAGRTLVFIDKGNASTNNITLLRNASEKISGLVSNYILNESFISVTVSADGTDWWVR